MGRGGRGKMTKHNDFPTLKEVLGRLVALGCAMILGTTISFIFQKPLEDGLTVWQWLRVMDTDGVFPIYMSTMGIGIMILMSLLFFWVGVGPHSFQKKTTPRLHDEHFLGIERDD